MTRRPLHRLTMDTFQIVASSSLVVSRMSFDSHRQPDQERLEPQHLTKHFHTAPQVLNLEHFFQVSSLKFGL